MYAKSFIEVQFPVSKVSKESYKERKAGSGQTLTGLGKWWGRKPLILVRAAILGLLMFASDNPKRDMEIFLKIMTMDEKGLLLRRNKALSVSDIYNCLTMNERRKYFTDEKRDEDGNRSGFKSPKWLPGLRTTEKNVATETAWNRFTYDRKLTYCMRPEEIENTDAEDWQKINSYLGTNASCLQELVSELSMKKFGRKAVVGDCFCGGGSIPFEAARMGCDVFASDLNPIAGLLTWADLNIAGADDEEIKKLREFQNKVYNAVDRQIIKWGIETNEKGERANSYLYCTEITCPECGHILPLSPSWIIGEGTKTIAVLTDNGKGFDIAIKSGVSDWQMKEADEQATVRGNEVYCLHCGKSIKIEHIRRNMRLWQKEDFMPYDDDVFRERLYCIRYTSKESKRYYTAPSEGDLKRERQVVELLRERFHEWQLDGYIPDSEIAEGDKTDEPIRTRGWKYWHQLFNPRQLLMHGLFMKNINENAETQEEIISATIAFNKCIDFNSSLCRWDPSREDNGKQTFYNQAFNTLYTWICRPINSIVGNWYYNIEPTIIEGESKIEINDARNIDFRCFLWITDPPYADAVNYHELSEFFLAWDKKLLKRAFPEWYTDSKRVLAVQGRDQVFNKSMVDIYKNLAEHMPDDGMQIIMFTHQDVSVWAELASIIWSAGLQITAAWTIATETESGGLKEGNYVKGTVLLVLRKQTSDRTAFLDEIMPEVEDEVKSQIQNMRRIDDREEPNFGDTNYLLAAYTASLKVLTSYRKIEDINVAFELNRNRKAGELSPIARVIDGAKKIAYDQLIPADFDNFLWKILTSEERFYIKGLEFEKKNIYQLSAYQELSKGFGVGEYKDLLENVKANAARLKTPIEWANRKIGGGGFSSSTLRSVFAALYLAVKTEDSIMNGRNWLKNELPDYWNKRELICEYLNYLSKFEHIANMCHWAKEAAAASILSELVKNDGV